jgi:DNA modification methylase
MKIPLDSILCGDCLELIRDIPDGVVDAVITDPPYFLGVTHNGSKGTYSDLIIMKPFFDALFFEINRVLQKNGVMYMCCDWRTYPFLYPIAEKYIKINNLLVWDKGNGRVSESYWHTHEFIMFHGKLDSKQARQNVIKMNRTNAATKIHPTQKPVELFEKFILDSTREGAVVLDTFAGSGTLAIAALRSKRHYICMEWQEEYCKKMRERVAQYTGIYNIDIENYKKTEILFNNKAA